MFLLLSFKLQLLVFHPRFEFPDRFAFHRQLHMGVNRVHIRASGMPHERHANFLQDAGFHQPSVKGVAEIVKADVADLGAPERRFPRGLHDADGRTPEVENNAFRSALSKQKIVKTCCEGNLAGFSFGRLRTGYEENLAREINVLPALAGNLAPAHASIKSGNDHRAQVVFRGC